MPVKIFVSYALEDEKIWQGLEKQLVVLKRQGIIDVWDNREISPGTVWEQEINRRLNEAQIILLLVSTDFVASDYCYGVEMKRAVARHESGEATVIPIILRPVYWKGTPFAKLQALPTNGKPISSWSSKDKAFFNVAEGIRKLAEQRTPSSSNQPDRIFENIDLGVNAHRGALVVYTNKNFLGNIIHLHTGFQEQPKHLVAAAVDELKVNGRTVFAAVFRSLEPGNYTVEMNWTGRASIITNSTVFAGDITEEDWRKS